MKTMTMKRSLVGAGTLMLTAAMLTGGMAAFTNPDGSAWAFGEGGPANPDPCRYHSNAGLLGDETCVNDPDKPWQHDRVSGNYHYNPAAFLLVVDPIGPLPTGPNVTACDDPDIIVGGSLDDHECQNNTLAQKGSTITFFPNGAFGAALIACDMEVLSDAVDNNQTEDEAVVNLQETTNGAIPDGFVDDGGWGGACDVYYSSNTDGNASTPPEPYAPYNAESCEGNIVAEDWVSGPNVFLSTVCDTRTTDDTGNGFDEIALALCAANDAIQDGPQTLFQDTRDCIDQYNNGVDPNVPVVTCDPENRVEVRAGSNGLGDGASWRHGSTFPVGGAPGVPINTTYNHHCPALGGGQAAVFIFPTVDTTGGDQFPTSGGWIDSILVSTNDNGTPLDPSDDFDEIDDNGGVTIAPPEDGWV